MLYLESGKIRTWTLLLAAIGLLGLSPCSQSVFAQTPPAPTATNAAEPNDPNAPKSAAVVPTQGIDTAAKLTLEELQARKKQATELPGLAEDAKTKLVEVYDKAIAQLNLAEELAGRKKQYSQAAKNVPATLEEIKAALGQPAATLGEVSPDLTLVQAEQFLTQATLDLDTARKNAAELEGEPKRRADRRTKIPEESNAARQQLDEIQTRLAAAPGQEQQSAVTEANQILLQLQQRALQGRIEANTEELLFYDAAKDLLTARRDLAARQVATLEKTVAFWQDKVGALRQQAAQAAKEQAAQAQKETEFARPVIQEIAQENTRLAGLQAELVAKMQKVTSYSEGITAKLAAVQKDLAELRQQVETAGRVTDTMGMLLLGKRDKLPSISESQRQIRNRATEISSAQLSGMEYDRKWSELSDLTDEMEAVEATLDPSLSPTQREAIKKEAAGYYDSQRKTLRAISDLYWDYATKLASLDTNERSLVKTVEGFANFIDANVLWVKSSHTPTLTDVRQTVGALAWLLSPTNWHTTSSVLWADLGAHPSIYILIALAVTAMVVFHAKLHRRISAISEGIRQIQTDSFLLTVQALVLTIVLAATWPILLLMAYWRLSAVATDDFVRALASGLFKLAQAVFVLSFLRHLAIPHGLAQDHFRLREEPLVFLRRHLRWFLFLVVPVVFVIEVMHTQQVNDAWYGTVGRLFFVAGLLGLAAFLLIVLRPTAPLMESYLKQRRDGWLERLRYFWYPLCLLIPLSFAILTGMGYVYGARHLAEKLLLTIGLILVVLLIRALFVRSLIVAQRRLALLERQKRLAAAEQKSQEGQAPSAPTPSGETTESKAKPEPTIFEMSQQTRRLIGAVATILLVAGIWAIWNDVLPAFAKLGAYPLHGVGEEAITLGSVVTALVVTILTVIVARNAPGLLEIIILRRLPIDRGVRFAIITVSRYVLVVIGLALAFTEIGIGWAKVQWLIAAMTVGLGFGLQEIFANFVSGLIILFEQPIRVDDIVTVGDVTGRVSTIKIRATTIRRWDQRELIVPNKEFITGQLINWTLSDNILRRDFPVGIAYGSDIRKAEKLLYEIAETNPRVLKDPAPTVLFKGFGDNSLDFELRVNYSGIEHNLPIWHDINVAIDDKFRAAGIEIAFPQHDLHVRSVDLDIPLHLSRGVRPPKEPEAETAR